MDEGRSPTFKTIPRADRVPNRIPSEVQLPSLCTTELPTRFNCAALIMIFFVTSDSISRLFCLSGSLIVLFLLYVLRRF